MITSGIRFWGVILAVSLASAFVAGFRWYHPYGARPACMPCVLAALQQYAREHERKFPDTDGTPLDALRLIYPRYLTDGRLLAGISGNRKMVEFALRDQARITEEMSSWTYWPGLGMDDNPEMAVIWEKRPGIGFNGKRANGYCVGFVNGSFRQIPEHRWVDFLETQSKLRGELDVLR